MARRRAPRGPISQGRNVRESGPCRGVPGIRDRWEAGRGPRRPAGHRGIGRCGSASARSPGQSAASSSYQSRSTLNRGAMVARSPHPGAPPVGDQASDAGRLARQRVVHQHQQRLVRRDPGLRQGEDHPLDRIEAPRCAAEEAVEARDVARRLPRTPPPPPTEKWPKSSSSVRLPRHPLCAYPAHSGHPWRSRR